LKNYKRTVIFITVAMLLSFVSVYLSIALHIAIQAERDTSKKADALLILGARSYIAGEYNPCLEARVMHAVELYKAGFASKIIVSGGNDQEDNVNEAKTMKKIAVEKGVPSSAILEEKAATSTFENFSLSAALLKKNNLRSVIVVTEPFHAGRAALVAKKLGYTFSVSPAKDSPCWVPNKYVSKYFLKEPIAIIGYLLQNKL
jgi:uncharacterized SAM-binding protein YcdF (DUF218 family)